MRMSAQISGCGSYRYSLTRDWGPGGYVMFIGLNPSTADATMDDPTIRRCIGYAKDWGYQKLVMTNLFAYRSTDPTIMKQSNDPIGPDNDMYLIGLAQNSSLIVAAWGTNGSFNGRDISVRKMINNMHYLKMTKGGHPSHPLYLSKTLKPVKWEK